MSGCGANGIVMAIRACGLVGGSVAKGMKKISKSAGTGSPDIIQQAIWLYLRFTLMSFRDVEDLLAERGIMTHRLMHVATKSALRESRVLNISGFYIRSARGHAHPRSFNKVPARQISSSFRGLSCQSVGCKEGASHFPATCSQAGVSVRARQLSISFVLIFIWRKRAPKANDRPRYRRPPSARR